MALHRYELIARKWLEDILESEKRFENFIAEQAFKEYQLTNKNDSSRTISMPWDELDDACKSCIFRQVDKYQDFKDDEGNVIGKNFLVSCSGIPKQYIKDDVFEKIFADSNIDINSKEAQEAKDNLTATRDPVTWGRLFCLNEHGTPWIARECQEVMLRCTSKRVVFRCGRRVGKSDALAVLALFYSFTQPFFVKDPSDGSIIYDEYTGEPLQQKTRILCITPRQSHADNLMGKIFGFLDRNPLLGNEVVTRKKNPYYIIEFKNGSSIVCLTAGTGTAGAGMAIRGFSADVVIFDEGNYLGEAELKAARAILATNINTMLRVSSTPVGKQDFFYEWCFLNPVYKEFHFPSTILPHWKSIKSEIYADVDTEDEFLHEYMADFSPSAQGVFRMDLVQKAKSNYSYGDCFYDEDCIYSVGVDWNTNAGTEIVCTQYNPITNHNTVVAAENVPKSRWTQLSALEKLIEMIRYWKPKVVCVDEGHGGTQIELLKKLSHQRGQEDPILFELRNTLISYNFSSKIEVRDPITGALVKKAAKPFLIQNAVRRFEEESISISSDDILLEQQLSHYEIKNISVTGIPTYHCSKPGLGDHRLDAMMLSLVGLKLKFGDLDRRSMAVSNISHVDSPVISIAAERRRLPGTIDGYEPEVVPARSNSSQDRLVYTGFQEVDKAYSNIPSRTSKMGLNSPWTNNRKTKSVPSRWKR